MSIRVGSMIKPSLKSSLNNKILPSLGKGAMYLLESSHKSRNQYFVIFEDALQLEATLAELRIFHMDLHPPTYVLLNIPNGRFFRIYVVLVCHANFHINWESFAHKDQYRNMFRIRFP